MKYVKMFESFLNEIKIQASFGKRNNHWGDERGSLDNVESRVKPKSNQFPDGWECFSLEETNQKGGKRNNKITVQEFLNQSGMTHVEFENKVSFTLNALVTSRKVKKTLYLQKDRGTVRTVILKIGKIIFESGDRYFSPLLIVEKGEGTTVWGVVRNNTGVTLKYEPEDTNTDVLMRKDYDSYRKSLEKRTGTTISPSEYYDNATVENLYSEKITHTFGVVIPNTEKWQKAVVDQCNTGKSYFEPKEEEEVIDPLKAEWKALFTDTMTKSTTRTIVDKGTIVFKNGEVGTVDAYNNGKYFIKKGDKKTMFSPVPGATIGIVEKNPAIKDKFFAYNPDNPDISSSASSEAIWNRRLSDADLFKIIRVDSSPVLNKTAGKMEIPGPIISRFIVLQNGKRVDFK